jgi:mono/diheme cytochrome c family protein
MPFPYYAKMSREEVKAIREYLSTVTPIHNQVTANILPFPFNLRSSMLVWDRLYFKPGEFHEDASKSKEWNRGAFLVQGPTHCGACHTPKSLLGGDKSAESLRGYTLQGWVAPEITSGQGPLGEWSADDIAEYLKNRHNKYAAAAGLMGEVVQLSTSNMTDADLRAIALYLKDVSGAGRTEGESVDQNVMTAGASIFQDLICVSPAGRAGRAAIVPEAFARRDRGGSRSHHGVARDSAGSANSGHRSRADRACDAGFWLATQ